MLGMQSVMLRVFVLVTRIRMYMLAAVILSLASIGVFALHNSTFDIWTLFWFGLLGFFMRQFGFPLAPMILGVVLGNIAELNLSRALAISTDLSPFVTRPWSLFFLIIAFFLALFSKGAGARRTLDEVLFAGGADRGDFAFRDDGRSDKARDRRTLLPYRRLSSGPTHAPSGRRRRADILSLATT